MTTSNAARDGSPLASAKKLARSWRAPVWAEVLADEIERLEEVAAAAIAYRTAQEECDRTGHWENAQEAAVVLDEALAALGVA